jgi:zinc finger SWIM domain-containing protein 3
LKYIEATDDSGIMPKAAYELATRGAGGSFNLGYTCRDHRNFLQTKRQRELAFGQAGSMLKYFHEKIAENPSFQYALQLDCEEHITNIFWADAKMMLDYAHFGDIVTFDTTFGTNKKYWPLGVFLDSISLERLLLLVPHCCLVKHLPHLNGSSTLF